MSPKSQRSALHKGIYSIPEAARLLGVSAGKVRRWLDPKEGLIPRSFEPAERVISFLELMELHFVRMFRAEGVSLQAIRKAAEAAAKKFNTDYPFAVQRFDTDGKHIFATLIDDARDEVLIEDLQCGQYVFEKVIRPFFRKLDFGGAQEVCRYWPLDKKHRIVLDPERQFGRPIDAPTGVPTVSLYNAVKSGKGQSKSVVADWYGVPVEAVEAAVAFEESLAQRAILL